jgi:hypothetical protein
MVDETLLCHDEIIAAGRRYQDNNEKTGQYFRKLILHTILERFCIQELALIKMIGFVSLLAP